MQTPQKISVRQGWSGHSARAARQARLARRRATGNFVTLAHRTLFSSFCCASRSAWVAPRRINFFSRFFAGILLGEFPWILVLFIAFWGITAQTLFAAVPTVVVMPFNDASKFPQAGWISEGIPELLQQYMEARSFNVLGRNERLVAFDKVGIPYTSALSKASLIKVGMELDVSHLIWGSYSVENGRVQLSANVLDLSQSSLSNTLVEEGELARLPESALGLAWQIIPLIEPGFSEPRQTFQQRFAFLPAPALERFIRGLQAADLDKQKEFFTAAEKAYPGYPQAIFELGRLYFRQKDYSTSASWLRKIAAGPYKSAEASFLLGVDSLFLRKDESALKEFSNLSTELPLNEVLANLGIALSRLGKTEDATAVFRKTLSANSDSADDHFNLAFHYWRSGNFQAVLRQTADVLRLERNDAEAHYLQGLSLQSLGKTAEASASLAKAKEIDPIIETWESKSRVPDLFRIQTRLDESSYRQVQMQIQELLNRKQAGQAASPGR
jgi:tetratricopeptide (TPR) repeat protein